MLGRADDVIITGGVKVSAAHVQAELEKLDGVAGGFCGRRPVRGVGPGPGRLRGAGRQLPGRRSAASPPPAAETWAPALGALAPKTVLAAGELLMLPNGKPDRLAHDGPAQRAASGKIEKRLRLRPALNRFNPLNQHEVLNVATAAQWIQGARLRTLPAAIAPVLIGTAAAYEMDSFLPLNAVLAALVALLLQIGVNYANDYSDGIRGTDEDRVGPLRLVGSGAAKPEHVKYAAFAAFGLAMVFGLALVIITQTWWLILVGIGCVLAAWGYTGGKNPYGYMGLGDVFVFVFFGLVATLGTTYTQAGQISLAAIIGAIGTGLIAVRPADGQQRPRHPDRQEGREEDPGRAARGQACPRKLRADAGRRDPAGRSSWPRPGRGC